MAALGPPVRVVTTTLTLVTSAATVAVGKPVTFTATVIAAAGAPTGPVRFSVDGGTATTETDAVLDL